MRSRASLSDPELTVRTKKTAASVSGVNIGWGSGKGTG
jgi:hypothetical protein